MIFSLVLSDNQLKRSFMKNLDLHSLNLQPLVKSETVHLFHKQRTFNDDFNAWALASIKVVKTREQVSSFINIQRSFFIIVSSLIYL